MVNSLPLASLLPHLLHSFRSEDDLVAAIAEMSLKFTAQREAIGDYLKDPRLVSAYAAFYFTTNVPKLEAVMPWLPAEWLERLRVSDLFDIGSGPGTFSFAWKSWGGTGSVTQLETSVLMREQAKKLWDAFFPGEELRQLSTLKEIPRTRERFVLFGHAANEMGARETLRVFDALSPDHVLFIEPGTKAFFPQMLEIRRGLIARGWEVIFPCPKALECPMTGTEDWCHQFVRVRHSEDVERLTQLAHKDRKLLPLIVHAYSRHGKFQKVSERVVRVHPETKFSFDWEVCHENVLERYQVMKRGLKKAEEKTLAGLLAGEEILTETEKEFDQIKRVRLLKSRLLQGASDS